LEYLYLKIYLLDSTSKNDTDFSFYSEKLLVKKESGPADNYDMGVMN